MENKYHIGQKTLWEKEKLLVKSNFPFSHNSFHSYISLVHQNEVLSGNGLTAFSTVFWLYCSGQCTYPCFPEVFLTQYYFKATGCIPIVEDILWTFGSNDTVCLWNSSKHCWKSRKCWWTTFSTVPKMFSKPFLWGSSKFRNVRQRLNFMGKIYKAGSFIVALN